MGSRIMSELPDAWLRVRPGTIVCARDLTVPMALRMKLAVVGLSSSSWSQSSGKWDIPRGGCSSGTRGAGVPGVRLPLDELDPSVVRRLRSPSNSICSSSPMDVRFDSSCKRLASANSMSIRRVENCRMIPAVPRIASAFGSDSGCSCSAIVRTWSRSPENTAASGTSLADFDS